MAVRSAAFPCPLSCPLGRLAVMTPQGVRCAGEQMGRVLVFREGEPSAGDRARVALWASAAPVFFGEQKGQDGAA